MKIPTADNYSDIMTKATDTTTFVKHVGHLMTGSAAAAAPRAAAAAEAASKKEGKKVRRRFSEAAPKPSTR
jgi:hypothetical protein